VRTGLLSSGVGCARAPTPPRSLREGAGVPRTGVVVAQDDGRRVVYERAAVAWRARTFAPPQIPSRRGGVPRTRVVVAQDDGQGVLYEHTAVDVCVWA